MSKIDKINQLHFPETSNPLLMYKASDDAARSEPHIWGKEKEIICDTDAVAYATPENQTPLELVVHASEGFIPLWAKGMILRWRFQERSMSVFQDISAAKLAIKELMGKALIAWGDAAPIKFSESNDAWDFEIVVRESDRCSINGCVLASAFFPDAGRHEFVIYPKMFTQSEKEQVDTFIHELGHTFGLRHFFAKVSETAWPSELYGTHKPFTIMNYGADSELAVTDKTDLKELYEFVWAGKLTHINGTPIKLVKPFHTIGEMP